MRTSVSHLHAITLPGLSLLLTLALLLPPMHSAMGRVLCVGDDGHIAIEAVGPHGDCSEPGGGPLSTGAPSTHHCGDCLDVSVSFDEATRTYPELRSDYAAPIFSLSPPILLKLERITAAATPPLPTILRRSTDEQKIVLII